MRATQNPLALQPAGEDSALSLGTPETDQTPPPPITDTQMTGSVLGVGRQGPRTPIRMGKQINEPTTIVGEAIKGGSMTGWSGAISDGCKEVSEEGAFEARSGLYKHPSGLRAGVRVHEGRAQSAQMAWKSEWLVLYPCYRGGNRGSQG